MMFQFFIIAILIFCGFRVINIIIKYVKITTLQKSKIKHIIPVFELLIWLTYTLWIVKTFYDAQKHFALISLAIVFVLIAYPVFTFLCDFITGLTLKLQDKIVEGSHIDFEDVKGTIIKAGYLRLDVEDNHGNISSITYGYIRGKKITRAGNNRSLEKVTLSFEFPETKKIDEFLASLKKEIINTHWIAISQTPIIENSKVVNGKLMVDVGVFMLDKSCAEDVKNVVVSHLLK